MNLDLIDQNILEFDLANGDSTSGHDWVANASVPFWFDRIEILDGTKIVQTIRDIDIRKFFAPCLDYKKPQLYPKANKNGRLPDSKFFLLIATPNAFCKLRRLG